MKIVEVQMNKHQAKLEAIKAKRLTYQERVLSLIITISLLVTAFYAIPVGLVAIGSSSGFGYDIKPQSPEWFSTALLIIISLVTILWFIFVFYTIAQSKKHFVRFLSGIKEK
jgi:hypothetical protein